MGNRGVLHDEAEQIRRRWQLTRWLVCVLEFRGRQRTVMTPGRYTELFFLDEATALSAGHRPCAECRRARFVAFANAWRLADSRSPKATAPRIDSRLHAERITSDGCQRHFETDLDELPDGVFVTRKESPERAYLVRGGHLLEWSPLGYAEGIQRPADERVTVLTPPSTVATIRAGYVPDIHPSAGHVLGTFTRRG